MTFHLKFNPWNTRLATYLLHHCQSYDSGQNQSNFVQHRDRSHLVSIGAFLFCSRPDRVKLHVHPVLLFGPPAVLKMSALNVQVSPFEIKMYLMSGHLKCLVKIKSTQNALRDCFQTSKAFLLVKTLNANVLFIFKDRFSF